MPITIGKGDFGELAAEGIFHDRSILSGAQRPVKGSTSGLMLDDAVIFHDFSGAAAIG